MNSIIKQMLDSEQREVIDSDKKYIIVSACPGSGKTYTLVNRIKKELENINENKGIIACSFTNEASDEIKKRLGYKYDLNNSFIGTIDSFIKYLIYMYVNRTLSSMGINCNQVILANKVSLPSDNVMIGGNLIIKNNGKPCTFNDVTRFYDSDYKMRKIADDYYNKEWLNKLINSQYEVSFPSYFFCMKMVNMKEFKDWFNNHFTSFYVDEAQDLNYFQHLFFSILKKETSVNIIMLGDPNQSIYQFRGAKPQLFNELVNNGYELYELSYSVRCNPNIMEIANRIYSNKANYIEEESVFKIDNISLEFLKGLKESTFILTDKNKNALDLYNRFNCDEYDIVYSKRFDFKNECNDYKDSSQIVDELIKYYYNYNNVEDKYKYPFSKIEPIIKNACSHIDKKNFDLKNYSSIGDFLRKSNTIIDIGLSDSTIDRIEELLEKDEHKHYYFLATHQNKIMTIHISKGLESDNVVIYLTSEYDKVESEEFKNQLFVALTRAKNKAFILSENNNAVSQYISELLNRKTSN